MRASNWRALMLCAATVVSASSARAGSYSVLYSFHGGRADGAFPIANLLASGGKLYGTTVYGGSRTCTKKPGCGTVFSVTPTGQEKVLHLFGGADGAQPYGGLTAVGAEFFGTTSAGGADNDGGVFSITPDGTETLLASFTRSAAPRANLTRLYNRLFSTTGDGGRYRGGTVFSVTFGGKTRALHGFGGTGDGIGPNGLLAVAGTLYGTTTAGGDQNNGTVFSITPSGQETVLHRFGNSSSDGVQPQGSLIEVNGALYGTTISGGANGFGTVFSVTPDGKETVLYSFKGGSADGDFPAAGLVYFNGTLYGTCSGGGPQEGGIVYGLSLSGSETIVHSFGATGDGLVPASSLTEYGGALYGTTTQGGDAASQGTVYRLVP